MSIFRPYRPSEAERSDRSASDRLRHRQKVRDSIRDNIADVIAEEAIIGKHNDKIFKIPLRGVKEFRFVYGDNAPGVGEGGQDATRGQVVGRAEGDRPGQGPAGEHPGQDYYETEVTLEELVDILFEDLELPDLERKRLREVESLRTAKRKGTRSVGIRARLDRKKTARAMIKRRIASGETAAPEEEDEEETRFRFRQEDLRYRRVVPEVRRESNAVVICIMDTSGSMDTVKKYLARSFFFLLHRFVLTKYQHVEVVFVAHHTRAREVTEEEFFSKGESGGTLISSGYATALQIIEDRYHPAHWNVYAFHCSDGDNFDSDIKTAIDLASKLASVCNLFGYGEIKPLGSHYYSSSMLAHFEKITAPNFHTVLIENKEDVWPSFQSLLSKERYAEAS